MDMACKAEDIMALVEDTLFTMAGMEGMVGMEAIVVMEDIQHTVGDIVGMGDMGDIPIIIALLRMQVVVR
jgi:hypothetical protein